ncbi:unnamed protein product [Caenorhabditis auriculariae]|uniref:Uncharacterized protein n=1 Tax=Caenorhabditis auriculariae TaxID=2777116 RepID=A0A8S1H5E4_9PELO|nr:unnamed protein product [Caenorhabditis auriculariae]
MWNSPKSQVIHVFQIGIGLVIGSCLVPRQFFWKKQDKGYYIQFEDKVFRAHFFLFAYLVETIFVVAIIIINLTMLLMFKRKYRLVFYLFYNSINDVYSGMSAWLILCYSKPMRLHINALLRCFQLRSIKNNQNNTVVKGISSATHLTVPAKPFVMSRRYTTPLSAAQTPF